MICAFLHSLHTQLNGYEVVRAVHLEPVPFTTDNGLVTPTLKLRRAALVGHYGTTIAAMYETIRQSGKY